MIENKNIPEDQQEYQELLEKCKEHLKLNPTRRLARLIIRRPDGTIEDSAAHTQAKKISKPS